MAITKKHNIYRQKFLNIQRLLFPLFRRREEVRNGLINNPGKMFKVGEKVSHPVFGVGDIKKIEDKFFLGRKQKYYILELVNNGMTLMIPVQKAKEIGLRNIIPPDRIKEVLNVLADKVDNNIEGNYKNRIKTQSELLSSGDILKVAQVVKNYIYLNMVDKLSATEKNLYERARKILESEIVAASNLESNKVRFMIKEAVNKSIINRVQRKNVGY